ncbi:MAG: tRNA (adenosine(37)-N6)-threonylcarbamoyltransferase complex dimerization subunit type 1 TsaB [Brevundimonas sp.]|uniref:tRNA (adenosine(37)-N6)-threonylcarbamoyltransferase complex dimerization subunit type 1 TsaB n=1 Tax=Brevundimonas sp. TaxID=1871086 RepID=UPI001225AF25|nr:tRNA (adenosine(37)-N6)-threonylcarbamoyltransferase complex dimerization subunit type 1 TsaB [Brevundimonas sp.]RZJ18444.1 MAG: tRNA (adenosine(37)-N6)-threonylcarbamoyltransferase complex dimerization subunit type 1 TsaB [Brevundimonas sp.]
MRVLALDTALGACTAAVFEDGRALAVAEVAMTIGHQERLAGLARDAVADAGGGFAALDRIGVTVGPGSFTGLRVGLAFAQGLGAALDRPVVGISTLDALAASTAPTGLVAALIDARRGQVYARLFRDGAPVSTAEPLALDVALERLTAFRDTAPGEALTLIGSGAALLAEGLPGATLLPLAAPTAEALTRLIVLADPAAASPRPLYLRAPDATPPTRLPGQPRPPRP